MCTEHNPMASYKARRAAPAMFLRSAPKPAKRPAPMWAMALLVVAVAGLGYALATLVLLS